MICPKCGYEMNDDAQFCISCGNRFVPGDHGLQKTSVQAAQKKIRKQQFLVIGVAIVLLVLLGAGYYLYTSGAFTGSSGQAQGNAGGSIMIPVDTSGGSSAEDISQPDTANPAEGVGVPLPSQSEEVLAQTVQLYWETISEYPNAVTYSLFNMLGDDLPELIIRLKDAGGNSQYAFFFNLNGNIVPVQGDQVAATDSDVLYGDNSKLIVVHSQDLASYVEIGNDLSANHRTEIIGNTPEYTDNILTAPANDSSLLDLILLGKRSEQCHYSGWFRHKNHDYYYTGAGFPVINQWVREEDTFYYLNQNGFAVACISQESALNVMTEYCEGFVEAVNKQDVAYLRNTSESNRENMQTRLEYWRNAGRTLLDYDCSIFSFNYKECFVYVGTRVTWTFTSDSDPATQVKETCAYNVTLAFEDGQWVVDYILY